MPIAVKRVYEPPSPDDGLRVLVDRLWPRGLTKPAARIDLWAKELAPSNELRQWYAHDAKKWPMFRRRFFAELKTRADAIKALALQVRKQKVTLLFASKEPRLNNAFALKQFLEARTRPKSRQARPAGKRTRRSPRR